jgi:aspartyl-tRNA(Asn)/glutamyl-tRNA(Gln) amidotransferase subunit A
MNVISGYDRNDPSSIDTPQPDFTADITRGVQGSRLGIDRDHFFSRAIVPPVRQAVETALAVLEGLGAILVDVSIPYLKFAAAAGMTLIMADTSSYHQKWLRERAEDYDPRTRFMLELGELILATDYLRALKVRSQLKAAMKATFDANQLDAMVAPTIPVTAVPVSELGVSMWAKDEGAGAANGKTADLSALIHHTIPFNLTGQPALTVPCGFSDKRLPIGLQIVGRPFDEPTVFTIGHAYEAATHWHLETPPI